MHSVNSDRASWSKTPAEASSSPASTHRKEGVAPAESALNSTHAGGRKKKMSGKQWKLKLQILLKGTPIFYGKKQPNHLQLRSEVTPNHLWPQDQALQGRLTGEGDCLHQGVGMPPYTVGKRSKPPKFPLLSSLGEPKKHLRNVIATKKYEKMIPLLTVSTYPFLPFTSRLTLKI